MKIKNGLKRILSLVILMLLIVPIANVKAADIKVDNLGDTNATIKGTNSATKMIK